LSGDFPAHLPAFSAGSLIAGYRLEAQVGAGGMAVVFRARDERLGRLVALKILPPALAADAAFRRRFIAEARAAATVDDPHIIPIYEAGEADGVLFIAMRFVRGGDLRLVLEREGALPLGRVAGFISPVASALDAAHGAGLVHRDVKPANILVETRQGESDHVYLSDFGVSKGAVSSVSLTAAGHFVGTPDYSAPEQIQGGPVDGRTDQYALACVAYQLLTGVTPFERDQGMAVLLAHLSQPPPSAGSLRPDLPGAADEVLARGMAKVPDKRYGSCRDFADALREALGTAPATAPPRIEIIPPQWPSPPETVTSSTTAGGSGTLPRNSDQPTAAAPGPARTGWIRRHRPLVIALAALVLAGAGVVPALLLGSPGKPGYAAIAGQQQITIATLDAEVSNLSQAVKRYPDTATMTQTQETQNTLTWLIRYQINEELARQHGITVSAAQAQAALNEVYAAAKAQYVARDVTNATLTLVMAASGIPPDTSAELGRYEAITDQYVKMANGGTIPTSSSAQTAAQGKLGKAQCQAAKALNIQVNPHFGRLDYTDDQIVTGSSTASAAPGSTASASASGLTPSC
jgi:serine/threonine protein kinase